MADQVQHLHSSIGETLYIHVRNSTGAIWNGSAFETYDSARWSFYDVAMTEQTSSSLYAVNFPSAIAAGVYGVCVYEQQGGSPALGDIPVGGGTFTWGGANFDDQSGLVAAVAALNNVSLSDIKAGILITPANPIAADGSGYVTITAGAQASIVTAVWAAGTRTLSSFGTLAADTATAVWAAGTRTLSSYGTLVADVATGVWGAATRTLTAFAFTPTTANGPTIAATVAKLEDTLEDDGGTYRFTTNSLEQAPSGEDATEAKQDTIITDIAALNDPSAAVVATAVVDSVVDNTLTVKTALRRILAKVGGKMSRTGTSPLTNQYFRDDDTTLEVTDTVQNDGSGRTKT